MRAPLKLTLKLEFRLVRSSSSSHSNCAVCFWPTLEIGNVSRNSIKFRRLETAPLRACLGSSSWLAAVVVRLCDVSLLSSEPLEFVAASSSAAAAARVASARKPALGVRSSSSWSVCGRAATYCRGPSAIVCVRPAGFGEWMEAARSRPAVSVCVCFKLEDAGCSNSGGVEAGPARPNVCPRTASRFRPADQFFAQCFCLRDSNRAVNALSTSSSKQQQAVAQN